MKKLLLASTCLIALMSPSWSFGFTFDSISKSGTVVNTDRSITTVIAAAWWW